MDNIDPKEFVAEENLNYKEMSVNEGVGEDDKTIKTPNVPLPPAEEPPSEAPIRSGPLTFDPTPHHKEDEDTMLAAANNQVELMQ